MYNQENRCRGVRRESKHEHKSISSRGGRRLSRLQASTTCVASTGVERSRSHYCASLSAVDREGLGSVHTSARENPRRLFGDGGSIELKMGSGDFGRDSAIRWMGGGRLDQSGPDMTFSSPVIVYSRKFPINGICWQLQLLVV